MLKDILTIIKYSVLLLSGFYGYAKIAKIKLSAVNIIDILAATIFGVTLFYATKYMRILVPTVSLLLVCIYMFIRYRKPLLDTITISTVSCGIAVFISAVIMLPTLAVAALLYNFVADTVARDIIMMTVICTLQIILVLITFRIKRFKSGISPDLKDGNIELLLLFGILSIVLTSLFYTDNAENLHIEIIATAISFCGLAIIIWWRKHISDSYFKKLAKRNEELYDRRIQEYETERNKLIEQNYELSKIIHRDNKLIPAMVAAIKSIIANAPQYDKNIEPLLIQLQELSMEHNEIIEAYTNKHDILPKTNIIPLDAIIRYLYSRSLQSNVEMSVKIQPSAIPILCEKTNNLTDLITLIGDLGENAIIATTHLPNGKILLSLELDNNGTSCILFYDNGELFSEQVIANMGKKCITTHKNDGGSGLGLMTIFKLLYKYNASYSIIENPSYNSFTKCIKLSFDNLHDIRVITTRETVKSICASRNDITITAM